MEEKISLTDPFRINKPTVVDQTLEGEAVIINLDKGYYYSLNTTGTFVWNGLEKHHTAKGIIEEALQHFEGNKADVETGVLKFMKELKKDNLIVPDEEKSHSAAQKNSSQLPKNSESKKPSFEPPSLQKFTDMQDFLLVDPIHDTDEMGWPHKKKDSASEP